MAVERFSSNVLQMFDESAMPEQAMEDYKHNIYNSLILFLYCLMQKSIPRPAFFSLWH